MEPHDTDVKRYSSTTECTIYEIMKHDWNATVLIQTHLDSDEGEFIFLCYAPVKQDETVVVCSWTRWADPDGGEFEFLSLCVKYYPDSQSTKSGTRSAV